MTDLRMVVTTAGSVDEAERLARVLVETRLAACVNITGVRSVYRWQGKVEDADEQLLLIKTTRSAFPQVRDAIRKMHSYDLPECIVFDIVDGSDDYLRWLAESVEAKRTRAKVRGGKRIR